MEFVRKVCWPIAVLLVGSLGVAAEAPRALTSVAQILSLSVDDGNKHPPVTLRGVVTAAEPDWTGKFMFQDKTAGIFITGAKAPGPNVGDFVEVVGQADPGAFAPVISRSTWTKLGTAPLPSADRVPIENILAGLADSQRIEVKGLVRSVTMHGPRLLVVLGVSAYRLNVFIHPDAIPKSMSLVGSLVRIRGTAASSFNSKLRHLTAVNVYVPSVQDFMVERQEDRSQLNGGVIPLNQVAQYRRNSTLANRIRVRGVVTFQRPGVDIFLQDKTGGLQAFTVEGTRFNQGEAVEAIGFLDYDNFLPVLSDAVVTPTGASPAEVAPLRPPVGELLTGMHPSELMALRGKLIGRSTRSIQRSVPAFSGTQISWIVQNPNLTFTAELETAEDPGAEISIPVGSVVEVTGVGMPETGDDGKLLSLKLLLPSAQSIRVIHRPSWFTPLRLVVCLAVLGAIFLAVLGWTVMVSKKNAALVALHAEREKVRQVLQEAHDTLEQKVAERTEQLKFEVTSRKSDELQFKAVIGERTRLAQELHDSLEQTLTGIGLQLDTTARLFGRSPADAQRHLELARTWMQQSRVDLRRSIWDLRSRELEEFELGSALRRSGTQITDGAGIHLDMEIKGESVTLPEVVEENILRIGQEALTNVVKHSGASTVRIELGYNLKSVGLRVTDNGSGFKPDSSLPEKNHFGLLGMSERVKRLGGYFEVISAPGAGATIAVEIPLA